jgi:DNA-binding GntR family transcriptional regulator
MQEIPLRLGSEEVEQEAEMTAAEQVARELRQRILSGELPGGAPVHQELIASQLGVSRIPVRDAIRILTAERLLVSKARSSAVVSDLGIGDLQELYDFRLAVEPMMSRLAVANLHRARLLMMEQLEKSMEATSDELVWLEVNDRFHRLLYSESGRPWMIEMLDQARLRTGRYTRLLVSGVTTGPANREHRLILNAAMERDGEALERHVGDHLRSGYDWVLGRLLETQKTR